MITTNTRKARLEQSENFPSKNFNIKQDAHIFKVLRSKIYSDKILAVIREYSCNAVDAHVEAGTPNKPIKITLPNAMNPHFIVRDFGRGMTDEDIFDIYATYGESTKRNTNSQIGQLGLGCKSGFAYSNSFLVISYNEGTKTVYNCFIDESEVGSISKMSSEKTKEPSGVEVKISVSDDDYNEFVSKSKDFYKFSRVRPDIHGINKRDFWESADFGVKILDGENFSMYGGNGEGVAIMGDVPYLVDYHALGYNYYNDQKTGLLQAGVVMNFDIGDLNVAASRESLEYDSLTKKNIEKRLNLILKEMPKLLSKQFENCKTMWDAKVLYNHTFRHGGLGSRLSNVVKGVSLEWNGKKINDATYSFQAVSKEDLSIYSFNKNHRGRRVKSEEVKVIQADEESLIIFDDTNKHQGRLNKIAPLIERYDAKDENEKDWKQVYLVGAKSSKGKRAISEKGLDCPNSKKMSDLPKVILRDIYPSNNTVSGGSGSVKNKKHSTKVFAIKQDYDGSRWENCRSNFFRCELLDFDDKKEKVYVEIDKFYVKKQSQLNIEEHPATFLHKLKGLKEAFKIKVPTIFSLKPPKYEKAKANKNWINFYDYYNREVKKYLLKGDNLQKIYDQAHCVNAIKDADASINAYCKVAKIKSILAGQESPMVDYMESFKEMKNFKKDKFDRIIALVDEIIPTENKATKHSRFGYRDSVSYDWARFIDYAETLKKDLKPTHNLAKKYKELMERYSFFECLDSHKITYENFDYRKLSDLINIIDATYITKKKIEKVKKMVDSRQLTS